MNDLSVAIFVGVFAGQHPTGFILISGAEPSRLSQVFDMALLAVLEITQG